MPARGPLGERPTFVTADDVRELKDSVRRLRIELGDESDDGW
jgi:hypothetical protein